MSGAYFCLLLLCVVRVSVGVWVSRVACLRAAGGGSSATHRVGTSEKPFFCHLNDDGDDGEIKINPPTPCQCP